MEIRIPLRRRDLKKAKIGDQYVTTWKQTTANGTCISIGLKTKTRTGNLIVRNIPISVTVVEIIGIGNLERWTDFITPKEKTRKKAICSIKNCNKPVIARNLCTTHYKQQHRRGFSD